MGQTASAAQRSPKDQVPPVPSLAAWQQPIVLGFVLVWFSILATLDGSVDLGTMWLDWYSLWTGSFLFAVPCLLAAWAALGSPSVLLRLPPALAVAAWLGLANGWWNLRYPGTPVGSISSWLLMLIPQLVVLTAAFLLLRHGRRWRIRALAGLETLARMPSLTAVGLDDTPISDAGLRSLASLPRLKVVYLANTKVTPQAMAAFQAAKPDCTIMRQGLVNIIRQIEAAGGTPFPK